MVCHGFSAQNWPTDPWVQEFGQPERVVDRFIVNHLMLGSGAQPSLVPHSNNTPRRVDPPLFVVCTLVAGEQRRWLVELFSLPSYLVLHGWRLRDMFYSRCLSQVPSRDPGALTPVCSQSRSGCKPQTNASLFACSAGWRSVRTAVLFLPERETWAPGQVLNQAARWTWMRYILSWLSLL